MINRSVLVEALIDILHFDDDTAAVFRRAIDVKHGFTLGLVAAELLTVVVFFRPIFFLYAVFMSYLFLETASGLHSVHACAGKVEEFQTPTKGEYKLEVWGAQGGGYVKKNKIGGMGGYSQGLYSSEKDVLYYVCVGGQGLSGAHSNLSGGFNGGGNSTLATWSDSNVWGCSGGGCSSIQKTLINDGQLQNYSSHLLDVIIVAGGGGGAGGNYQLDPGANGGAGGGTAGEDGDIYFNDSSVYPSFQGYGGTQNKGGTRKSNNNYSQLGNNGEFGKGGDGSSGAGGGLYGGGADHYSAGGGSGYVGSVENGLTYTSVKTGNGRALISITKFN